MPENMASDEKDDIWNVDLWAPYRGKYLEPTTRELHLICNFLTTFDCEKDDFVEDEEWRSFKEEVGIENLRRVLIDFLDQVRESKGYDVEYCLGFFNSPFVPLKISEKYYKDLYDRMMEAATVAITAISAETRENGKMYKLVTVEKQVRTRNRMFLLTLAVKEVDVDVTMVDADVEEMEADSGVMKTIRAMVFDPVEAATEGHWPPGPFLNFFSILYIYI